MNTTTTEPTLRPAPTWRIAHQAPILIAGRLHPGYTQIDLVDDRGHNHGSTNPETLAARGYYLPDFGLLPTGNYIMSDLLPEPVATFVAVQRGFGIMSDFELWRLRADIPGHRAGSNLARQTIEAAGYWLPAAPIPARAPTHCAA
jgi:hypothetical protein